MRPQPYPTPLPRWPRPLMTWVQRYREVAQRLGPEHPAAQAARGRFKAARRSVPAQNAKSPAAIAAHRALGRTGYLNRRYRAYLGSPTPSVSQATEAGLLST